jgi:hypothetical protein
VCACAWHERCYVLCLLLPFQVHASKLLCSICPLLAVCCLQVMCVKGWTEVHTTCSCSLCKTVLLQHTAPLHSISRRQGSPLPHSSHTSSLTYLSSRCQSRTRPLPHVLPFLNACNAFPLPPPSALLCPCSLACRVLERPELVNLARGLAYNRQAHGVLPLTHSAGAELVHCMEDMEATLRCLLCL